MLASVLTFRFFVTSRRTSSRGESDFHCGQTQGVAPGGEAAAVLLLQQLFFEMELGDNPLEDGFALEDFCLRLEIVLGRVRTTSVGGGAHLAHVEEILIDTLNFQRGTRLVDRRLRKREQD